MTDSNELAIRGLWAAVDLITKPTSRKVDRGSDADWLEELRSDTTMRFCDVQAYRAATLAYGTVPSLWEQATWALTTGSESSGGSNASPLAMRSPADLDLMEIMATVREVIALQLDGRKIHARTTVPEQVRQLAAHVVGHEPQHVAWWEFRFAQWARLLGVYLQAVDTGPKPIRLRTPCPLCKTRQVTIESDNGPVVVPPILVDFENGWIRAATCTACTAVWWRGDDLNALADLLDTPTSTVVAESA
jgi:hypothetical protein